MMRYFAVNLIYSRDKHNIRFHILQRVTKFYKGFLMVRMQGNKKVVNTWYTDWTNCPLLIAPEREKLRFQGDMKGKVLASEVIQTRQVARQCDLSEGILSEWRGHKGQGRGCTGAPEETESGVIQSDLVSGSLVTVAQRASDGCCSWWEPRLFTICSRSQCCLVRKPDILFSRYTFKCRLALWSPLLRLTHVLVDQYRTLWVTYINGKRGKKSKFQNRSVN